VSSVRIPSTQSRRTFEAPYMTWFFQCILYTSCLLGCRSSPQSGNVANTILPVTASADFSNIATSPSWGRHLGPRRGGTTRASARLTRMYSHGRILRSRDNFRSTNPDVPGIAFYWPDEDRHDSDSPRLWLTLGVNLQVIKSIFSIPTYTLMISELV
jgi:hypothetical protein